MPTEPKEPRKAPADYARYSGLAFEMLAIIGVGTWGGVKLDEYLGNNTPWFTVVLAPLSVFISLYIVLKDLNRKK